jgi:hypothetical protein
MCWEQSHLKRTIATSRSEATATETNPEKATTIAAHDSTTINKTGDYAKRYRYATTRGKPFPA